MFSTMCSRNPKSNVYFFISNNIETKNEKGPKKENEFVESFRTKCFLWLNIGSSNAS